MANMTFGPGRGYQDPGFEPKPRPAVMAMAKPAVDMQRRGGLTRGLRPDTDFGRLDPQPYAKPVGDPQAKLPYQGEAPPQMPAVGTTAAAPAPVGGLQGTAVPALRPYNRPMGRPMYDDRRGLRQYLR